MLFKILYLFCIKNIYKTSTRGALVKYIFQYLTILDIWISYYYYYLFVFVVILFLFVCLLLHPRNPAAHSPQPPPSPPYPRIQKNFESIQRRHVTFLLWYVRQCYMSNYTCQFEFCCSMIVLSAWNWLKHHKMWYIDQKAGKDNYSIAQQSYSLVANSLKW